jgi:hypothetical protein
MVLLDLENMTVYNPLILKTVLSIWHVQIKTFQYKIIMWSSGMKRHYLTEHLQNFVVTEIIHLEAIYKTSHLRNSRQYET